MTSSLRRKLSLTLFGPIPASLHQKFSPSADALPVYGAGIIAVEFESAKPSVVKSIKQRDLLNTWLRLYAREDGGFEIKNLMRGLGTLPTPRLRCVIDRDLFHRAPGHIESGDVIEFS